MDLEWTAGAQASELRGYLVYRDGHLLTTRADRASDCTATASSYQSSYRPEFTLDRSLSTSWRTALPLVLPQWLQLDFQEPTTIGEVAIRWFSQPQVFSIQVKEGGIWRSAQAFTEEIEYSWRTLSHLDEPASVDGIRVLIEQMSEAATYIGIIEIAIYEPWPLPHLAHQDKLIGAGGKRYFVQGIDLNGARTLTSNEVVVQVGDVEPPSAPLDVQASNQTGEVVVTWIPNDEPDLLGYIVHRNSVDIASAQHGCICSDDSSQFVLAANDGDLSTSIDLASSINQDKYLEFAFSEKSWITRMEIKVSHERGAEYRFIVEGSIDGETWAIIEDRTQTSSIGDVEVIVDPPAEVKFIRFIAVYNEYNGPINLTELEAYSDNVYPRTPGQSGKISASEKCQDFISWDHEVSYDATAPRRFFFRSFHSQEDDPLIIEDSETGKVLARFSGDLGSFITPYLTAKNYRFRFEPDFFVDDRCFDITSYSSLGIDSNTSFSENIYRVDDFQYGVSAVDRTGNQSEVSYVLTQLSDTEPPQVPLMLEARGRQGVIELEWAENDEPDLAGYNVYRQDLTEPLNGTLSVQEPWFEDHKVAFQESYTYWLTAVDINGNESGPTEQVTVFLTGIDLQVEGIGSAIGNQYDILVFPRHPAVTDDAKIIALIANNGVVTSDPVAVSFYDGDPATDGVLIGNAITQGQVPAEGNAVAIVNWPFIAGQEEDPHNIYVVVDPDNEIIEQDENNNTGFIDQVIVHHSWPLLANMAEIDPQAFPVIKVPMLVTDRENNEINNLTEDNFDIREDDKEVIDLKVEEIVNQHPKIKMDIVFMATVSENTIPLIHPTLCNTIKGFSNILESLGIDVIVKLYYPPTTVDWSTNPGLRCAEILSVYVLDGELVPYERTDYWMPAVTWASMYHPWRDDAIRFIVPAIIGSAWADRWLDKRELFEEPAYTAVQYGVEVFSLGEIGCRDPRTTMSWVAEQTGGTFNWYHDSMETLYDILGVIT